jgi:hypothetical protein
MQVASSRLAHRFSEKILVNREKGDRKKVFRLFCIFGQQMKITLVCVDPVPLFARGFLQNLGIQQHRNRF